MKFSVKSLAVIIGIIFSSPSQAELVYLAKVNFAGTMFNDILVLEAQLGDKSITKGSLTVPGQFTTKFVGHRNYYRAAPSIQFKTTAIENGKTIIIEGYLEEELFTYKNLTGYLDVYLNDGKDKVRAKLSAELIYKDDK